MVMVGSLSSGHLVSKLVEILVTELKDLTRIGGVRDRTAGEDLPPQPVKETGRGG